MGKTRPILVAPAIAICASAGTIVALFAFQAAPAVAGKAVVVPKPTTVIVTAGKPSELSFKLSRKAVPAGKVIFKITNRGQIAHTFKICSSPKGGKVNACRGTTTKLLAPGKSATITVTLKKGTYEYLCTVPGHAAAGMKGLIGVGGVKIPITPTTTAAATTTAATTTVATTTAATTTTASGGTCVSNAATSVTVSAYEFAFTLSQTSMPCGTVTFNVTDTGSAMHNFHVEGTGATGATVGAVLNPGQSASQVVTFTQPGTYTFLCDVPGHARLGMIGTITITP
jgi:nitrite reductase (NO-forming)